MKEKQKQHLIDMMKEDENNGMYELPKQQSIEESADDYAKQEYWLGRLTSHHYCKKDFIAGAKSQAAKEYWYEQFKLNQ